MTDRLAAIDVSLLDTLILIAPVVVFLIVTVVSAFSGGASRRTED